MFPRLHRYLGWGCTILDVAEPELYVTVDPVPNAYTYGHTSPFIVLTSGLVDMLGRGGASSSSATSSATSRPATCCTRSVARNIAAVVELVGQATLGIGALLGQGLVFALLDWYRKAELTADRAGCCACRTRPRRAPS